MQIESTCWPWRSYSIQLDLSSTGPSSNDARARFVFGNDSWPSVLAGDQPITDSVTYPHLGLLGSFEIHNLADLAETLGFDGTPGDNAVLLAAWARWGTSLAEHLEGQFSFVILDQRERRVFACVDHLGTLPLLYRLDGALLTLAGDMESMLHILGAHRELNPAAIIPFSEYTQLSLVPGETLHKGVYALPPACFLTVRAGHSQVHHYWALSYKPELVPSREADVYEKALHLAERSVQNRLGRKTRVAILFSGGLDSSALAVLTARCLSHRGLRLLALGGVNDPANRSVADERTFMGMLRGIENMDLDYVESPGRGPFDDIEDPEQFQVCARLPSLRYFFDATCERATMAGSELLINGAAGEWGISGTPRARFMELALQFRFPSLVRELRLTSTIRRLSALRLFAGEIRAYYGAPRGQSVFFLSPGFRPDAAFRPMRRLPSWPNSREAQMRERADAADRCAISASQPRRYILSGSRPFQDKNLLEYCLAVPGHFKFGNGYGRLLLRKSFDGLLPKELVWRRGKMWASPDYNWRYNSQIGKAIEFVRSIRPSDPVRQIVDVERLQQATRPIGDLLLPSGEPRQHLDALARVPETINLINFLRQFSAFRV